MLTATSTTGPSLLWRPGPRRTLANVSKRWQPYLQGEQTFLANYGDGLSDVPLPAMMAAFQRSNAIASLLLVQPTASFDLVTSNRRDGLQTSAN